MNCPSRTDPEIPDGHNQSPNTLNTDATTRADLGYVANTRARNDHRIDCHTEDGEIALRQRQSIGTSRGTQIEALNGLHRRSDATRSSGAGSPGVPVEMPTIASIEQDARRKGIFSGPINVIRKYMKFVGPGFMVAVAYIDPGTFTSFAQREMQLQYYLDWPCQVSAMLTCLRKLRHGCCCGRLL